MRLRVGQYGGGHGGHQAVLADRQAAGGAGGRFGLRPGVGLVGLGRFHGLRRRVPTLRFVVAVTRVPGGRGVTAPGLLDGAQGLLAGGVAVEVQERLVRLLEGLRADEGGSEGQRCLGGLQRELAAAFEGTGALALGGGVAAEQIGVFGAQPGQLGALGAQPGVQAHAQLAGLVEVRLELGYALVGVPFVTGAGGGEVGDAATGGPVPRARHDRTAAGGHRGRRDDRAQHQRIRADPGGGETGRRCPGQRQRGQQPVQWG
ncbi:hypothetical protein M2266_003134 [Streptomyces sp. SPB162]|nr:hypothetical protein [Streptomyces sp. SPB162]